MSGIGGAVMYLGLEGLLHIWDINVSLQELKKYNAKTVARCCEPTYSTESLAQEGIKVVVSDAGGCDHLSGRQATH